MPDSRIATLELLEDAFEGCRSAAGSIIERVDPALIAMVRHYLGPRRYALEGEDLLQEVRLAVCRGLQSFRGRDRKILTAWIKTIVRRKILDWEKHRRADRRLPQRTLRRLDDTRSHEPRSAGPTPSKIFLRKEERCELREAIASTHSRYRPVLRLICTRQPTSEEIARFLDKEPEAARKFTERALNDLRRVLRRRGQLTSA